MSLDPAVISPRRKVNFSGKLFMLSSTGTSGQRPDRLRAAGAACAHAQPKMIVAGSRPIHVYWFFPASEPSLMKSGAAVCRHGACRRLGSGRVYPNPCDCGLWSDHKHKNCGAARRADPGHVPTMRSPRSSTRWCSPEFRAAR